MNLNIDKDLAFQTLHGHTHHSDGDMSYTEVLDACEKHGIGVYAFTDHDFVPDKECFKELDSLKDHRVKYIVGTELSCTPPAESNSTKGIHIVGLFIDPFNQDLVDSISAQKAEREHQFKAAIKAFKEDGFEIDEQQFQESLKKGTIASPEIHNLINNGNFNQNKMLTAYESLKNERDLNDAEQKAISYIESIDAPNEQLMQIFYNLYINHSTRLNHEPKPRIPKPTFEQNVKLIRNAGGVAIFAHYTFGGKQLGFDFFKQLVEDKRVDGVEVVFGKDERDFRKEVQNDMQTMVDIADETGCLRSGGGDIHTLKDLEFFTSKTELTSRTTSLIQDILKNRDADQDLQWSSLQALN